MARKGGALGGPMFNHKNSVALLDTAEELVDSLDTLAVCLRHIEEKYGQKDEDISADDSGGLLGKLRENVEAARELTDTLKREKWRLSRRQLSVELRREELEEVKTHMKRDMCNMNMTVEELSARLIQLENALCDAGEEQDTKEAELAIQNKRVEFLEKTIEEMKLKESSLQETIQKLRLQRTDSQLRMQSEDLTNRMEVLLLENQRLKEIIRENEETYASNTSENKTVGESSANKAGSIDTSIHSAELSKKGSKLGAESSAPNGTTEESEIAYV